MIAALAILGLAFLVSEVRYEVERRAWKKQEADLMNRLMARTYGEYAAFESAQVIQSQPPQRRTLVDDTGLIEVDADEDG